MKTLRHSRRTQLGISLVEISIAAVVISAVLLGILVGLPKLQLDQRLNKARQEVPLALNTMMVAYATQPNTLGANTQILSAANVWPNERVSNSGLTTVKVNGVFPGSTEHVFANTATTALRLTRANDGFAYWIRNIPAKACLPLVQLLISQRGVVEVSVGAATLNPSGGKASTVVSQYLNSSLSANMSTATTACSAAGNKTVVALVSRA
jgi:type II secretory pathway pseudopilin PulG